MSQKQVIETSASSNVNFRAELLEHQQKRRTGGQPREEKRHLRLESKQKKLKLKLSSQADSEPDVFEQSRSSLQKKAKLYDTLTNAHFDADQLENMELLLVDFERKKPDAQTSPPEDSKRNDEWVECEDEFGRTRVVRKRALEKISRPNTLDGNADIYSSESSFASRAHIRHYDSRQENRTVGVGHYGFAQDNGEREEQMRNLKELREQTTAARSKARPSSDRRKAILAKRAEYIHERHAQIRRSMNRPRELNDQVTELLQTYIQSSNVY